MLKFDINIFTIFYRLNAKKLELDFTFIQLVGYNVNLADFQDSPYESLIINRRPTTAEFIEIKLTKNGIKLDFENKKLERYFSFYDESLWVKWIDSDSNQTPIFLDSLTISITIKDKK